MSTRRPGQRHHCTGCNRFVREASVSVYWSMEEGCEIGWGECSACGYEEVYLDRWDVA